MRKAEVSRKTKETEIELELNLDGGESSIQTDLNFLSHMLSSMAKFSCFGLKINAKSLDGNSHHLVEDVAIVLGEALLESLGDKKGIERTAYSIVPMDDSVATVSIDLSGRPYTNISLPLADYQDYKIEDVRKEDFEHFLETLALNGKLNLYIEVRGKNDHHKVEAVFKALGNCLKEAVRITGTTVKSTKEVLK